MEFQTVGRNNSTLYSRRRTWMRVSWCSVECSVHRLHRERCISLNWDQLSHTNGFMHSMLTASRLKSLFKKNTQVAIEMCIDVYFFFAVYFHHDCGSQRWAQEKAMFEGSLNCDISKRLSKIRNAFASSQLFHSNCWQRVVMRSWKDLLYERSMWNAIYSASNESRRPVCHAGVACTGRWGGEGVKCRKGWQEYHRPFRIALTS